MEMDPNNPLDPGFQERSEEEREGSEEDIFKEKQFKIPPELDCIRDIPMRVSVELGRAGMMVKDLIKMLPNTVLELEKLVGEPLEILINDQVVARGEVVVINEKFGIRLTDIVSPLESTVQV